MSEATPSAIVLIRFAPIASCVSTIRCTTACVSAPTWTNRTSTSWAPPPRAFIAGWSALAAARMDSFSRRMAARAASGWLSSVTCTWPIIRGGSASAEKPPPSRTIFAASDTAAITDGSSTAMGMSTSSPLMRKLSPTPTGSPSTPMAFSIIASALASGSVPLSPRPSRSGYSSASASRRSRSAIFIL